MASRRGLSAEEIQDQLDRLLAEDNQKDVMPGIPIDVQSDVKEGDTEYEDDSEDEVADITDPLQHLSCGLAPAVPTGQGVGLQPDFQLAGSSRGTIGSSAPGWCPDLPPMPSDQRTSPYPSRRSEHRTPPPTVSKLSIIFNS